MQHDSFLPDEYIEHRRNRRTSYLVMAMFLVVVASIGGAFLHRHFVLQDALERQQNVMSRYDPLLNRSKSSVNCRNPVMK